MVSSKEATSLGPSFFWNEVLAGDEAKQLSSSQHRRSRGLWNYDCATLQACARVIDIQYFFGHSCTWALQCTARPASRMGFLAIAFLFGGAASGLRARGLDG